VLQVRIAAFRELERGVGARVRAHVLVFWLAHVAVYPSTNLSNPSLLLSPSFTIPFMLRPHSITRVAMEAGTYFTGLTSDTSDDGVSQSWDIWDKTGRTFEGRTRFGGSKFVSSKEKLSIHHRKCVCVNTASCRLDEPVKFVPTVHATSFLTCERVGF
jgi:hypothetical protein